MLAQASIAESSLAYELNKRISNRFGFTFIPGIKLKDIEKEVILKTLASLKGNRTHTARVLGIGIRTLQRKLKKYASEGVQLEMAS